MGHDVQWGLKGSCLGVSEDVKNGGEEKLTTTQARIYTGNDATQSRMGERAHDENVEFHSTERDIQQTRHDTTRL